MFLRIPEICCLLILNLSAKFVPFSLISKCEIMVSFPLSKEQAAFIAYRHGSDRFEFMIEPMWNQAWHSLSNITIIEHIRIQLNNNVHLVPLALFQSETD